MHSPRPGLETSSAAGPLLFRDVRWGLRGALTDVLVRDGAVEAAAAELRVPDARVVEGRGGSLLPGLRDRHVHMTQWATGLQRLDLSTAGSAADVVARLSSRADRPGILWGRDIRDALWPDRPHRRQLDDAFPGRVVAVVSADLHALWLSSAALDRLGVQDATGVLREGAAFDALGRLADVPEATEDRWVLDACRLAAGRGVTGILDVEFHDTVAAWRRRSSAGPLPLRVEAAIYRPLLPTALLTGLRTGDIVPGTQGLVRIGPCKVLLDGSLNTRTAYCSHPYPDDDTHGTLTADPAELVVALRYAAAHGVSFAVHAIGDAANRLALDAFAEAAVPGRIEHAQLVDGADLARFAALGVVASVQPAHAPEDRDVADRIWAGQSAHAFPYGSLLRAGATLEFGSDAPVSALDPWRAIAAAVYRTLDSRPGWHPEEALSLDEAVAASTGAGVTPSLGMPADLTLTAGDPALASREQLQHLQIRATVLAGRLTHLAD